MNIWLAALYSLGILGAGAIFLVWSMRFMEWVFCNDHLEVGFLVAIIVCWIVLTISIYVEGGAV